MSADCEPGLVSVVVPTYNRARLLVETLDSVRAQTYRPIELLVVDDGSTDGTRRTLRRWRRNCTGDDGLKVRCCLQQNRGVSAAINLGLIRSRGEYVQVLGSDDLLHPDKLTLQAARLRGEPALDLVYSCSGVFRGEPDWQGEPRVGRPTDDALRDYLLCPAWSAESPLYRRAAAVANGPVAEDVTKWVDWEYNIRLVARRPAVGHVRGVLSLVREHDEGRIADTTFTAPGLRGMLRAVQRVERTLRATGHGHGWMRRALASRYLLIVDCACDAGLSGTAREAFRCGMALRGGAWKWVQFQVFRLLAGLPAGCAPAARRLLSAVASVGRGYMAHRPAIRLKAWAGGTARRRRVR
jgi:glycosyltransferase involved in cell wall biosynthesis